VIGRRKSKRLSDVLRREYTAAMTMLETDFDGGERDYCCAADDFKRHPPLACDLMGSPRTYGYVAPRPSIGGAYGNVQAASR